MNFIKVKEVNENLLQEIVDRIVKAINPVKIILFGSYGYGEPKKGSDLDILVVMDNNIRSRHEVASKVYGALRGILIPKDVVVVTLNDVEEWRNVPQAFITKIIQKGRVLYERQD